MKKIKRMKGNEINDKREVKEGNDKRGISEREQKNEEVGIKKE